MRLYYFFFNWLYQSTLQTSFVSSLYCCRNWGIGEIWWLAHGCRMSYGQFWKLKIFPTHHTRYSMEESVKALLFVSRCFCPVLLGLVSKGEKVVQVPQLVQPLVSWQRLPTSWQVTAKTMTGGTFYDVGSGQRLLVILHFRLHFEGYTDSIVMANLGRICANKCCKWPLPC